MKHITIKVTVPNKGDSWKISIGTGRPRKKKNAVAVFRHAERFLTQKLLTNSASEVEYKIKVLVDYSAIDHERQMRTFSHGLYAEKNEALYDLAMYLEDYLTNRYLNMKFKIYGKNFDMKGGGIK